VCGYLAVGGVARPIALVRAARAAGEVLAAHALQLVKRQVVPVAARVPTAKQRASQTEPHSLPLRGSLEPAARQRAEGGRGAL